MKTIKRKGVRTGTMSKYLNCLTAYQQKSGHIFYVNEIAREHNIDNALPSFLRQKEIIYKKNGFYYWNDAYEPSIKIVNGFLNYKSIKNSRLINKKPQSIPTLFDQKNNIESKVKTQPIKLENIEEMEKISIRDAVRTFGKSDSYFRRIQREWKVSKPKAVFMYEGKVHFDLNELNKKFKKNFVEKVKEQPNVNNTVQVGVIRKFIKWLW